MKSKISTLILTLSCATLLLVPVNASADNLGTCFIDSLNGKERKQLVKWMFFSMSTHPELEAYSNISANNLEASEKAFATLITRLLAEDCPEEAKEAQRTDPQSIKKAVELVVKVPIKDLLANKEVRLAISNSAKYIDQEKIKRVFAN